MHCFANICYVCLKKKSKLIRNINGSLSVNKDIIHIIGHLPCNLAWLNTLRIILICEACCLRLRETYKFLETCLKNSALLQGYVDILNTTSISNTENDAELFVKLNIAQEDADELKCEIQSEEMYAFQWQPNIEKLDDVFVDFEDSLVKEGIICKMDVDDKPENNSTGITEDKFVNVEDYFVKEENTWKREQVDDTEEYLKNNTSTESDKAHVTSTDGVSSGFTSNENDLNAATKKSHKCSTCSKSFITHSVLIRNTRIHTGEKPYECSKCKRRFPRKDSLVIHMRVHTGEKPYKCSICKKCFTDNSNLVSHARTHTGEKPYKCSECKEYFHRPSYLVSHMRIHTGEKLYSCSICKKCFTNALYLGYHMRIHTGAKPYSCSRCKKRFNVQSNLVRHMRTHTGAKPVQIIRI